MVSQNIFTKSRLYQYVLNTSWMLLERVLRIFAGVFVGIYVARYLGPEQYGILSYILAIVSFATAFVVLGMNSILVRELVARPDHKKEILGTSFWMMMSVAIICFGLFSIYLVWFSNELENIKFYTVIVMLGILLIPFWVFDYLFQAEVKAKYSTICKSVALLIVSVARIYFVLAEEELIWFVIFAVVENAILAVLLFVVFLSKKGNLSFLFAFSRVEAKDMIKSAWPRTLSAVAVLVYMRIDQVMIRNMMSLHDVGIYSVAIKLYEAWIFIPYIVTMSLLPAITKLKNEDPERFKLRMMHLYRFIVVIGVIAASGSWFLSEWFIILAFGEVFKDAAMPMNIVMLAAIFVSIGSVTTRYFSVEKMENKIVTRTVLAAIINIILNILLIPEYGITGAAIATLVCTFVSNYLIDWFDRDLKGLQSIKNQAMFGRLLTGVK